jgi:NAD dependent epimerase/dehydratase family enzyme
MLKDRRNIQVIELIVDCNEVFQSALFGYWRDASFSLRTDHKEKTVIAGIVHSLPCIVHKSWNVQPQEKRREYMQKASNLVESIKTREQRPSVCVVLSSSAYYGSSTELMDEGAPCAANPWARWIEEYEQIFSSLQKVGIRVVVLRLGTLIFSKKKQKQLFLEREPEDWVSWVHMLDVCRFVDFCLRNAAPKGVYNLVAPNINMKRDFSSRSQGLFVPLMNRLIYSSEYRQSILPSQRVVSNTVRGLGFEFYYPRLADSSEKIYIL